MLIDSLHRVVLFSPDHSKIYHFAPNTYQEDGNLDEGNTKSFISTEWTLQDGGLDLLI
jgi:hypothetical protein